jgi:hypothetical protein
MEVAIAITEESLLAVLQPISSRLRSLEEVA